MLLTHRHTITLLLLIFIVISSCDKNTDWQRDGISSEVKSVHELEYRIEKRFGEWHKTNIVWDGSHNLSEYNKEGMITATSQLSNDLSLKYKAKRHYKGNNLDKIITYNSSGKEIFRTEYNNYSKEGWEYEVYDTNGVILNSGEAFLSDGKVVKEIYRFSGDTSDTNTVYTFYTYNDSGWLEKEEEKFDENSDHSARLVKYKYLSVDENGNWLKRIYFLNDIEEPIHMHVRTYEYY